MEQPAQNLLAILSSIAATIESIQARLLPLLTSQQNPIKELRKIMCSKTGKTARF